MKLKEGRYMKVQTLSKRFENKTLFENLSFEIDRGLLLLVGKNGSGKSTLIKMLAGFDSEYDGEISYEFKPVISFMGQEDTLCVDLSFKENYKIIIGNSYSELTQKLIKLLEFQSLDDELIINLSKGERVKAEIIFSLSKIADVYFLDEPFSSLDTNSRLKLIEFLNDFLKDHLIVISDNSDIKECLDYNLKIELNANFCQIEEKTFKHEASLSKVGEKSIDSSKTKFVFTKAFIRARRSSLILTALLFLVSCLTMALGFDFTNFMPKYESEILSLKDDPMEQFHILYEPSKNEEVLPFEIIEGQEVLMHPSDNTFIFKTDENINHIARLTNRSNIDATKATIGETEYKIIDIKEDSELVEKYLPQSLEFKRIKDNQSRYIYYFVSGDIFDSIFINGFLNTDINGFLGFDYRIKNIENNIVHLTENIYPEFYENIKIEDTDEFEISFVDFKDGETVYLYNDCDSHLTSEGNIKLINKREENISYNRMSLRIFKLFLTSLGSDYLNYKCFHNKEDCKNILYKYKSSVYLMINNIMHNNNKNDMMIIFFSVSLVSFIFFLILFISIVIKNRRWKKSIFNFYRNNSISNKTRNRDIGIFTLLFTFPIYLISVITYFACLPLANFYSYKHWQFSIDEYFDLNIIINFYRYSPMYLITLLFIILVSVFVFKCLVYQKKKE